MSQTLDLNGRLENRISSLPCCRHIKWKRAETFENQKESRVTKAAEQSLPSRAWPRTRAWLQSDSRNVLRHLLASEASKQTGIECRDERARSAVKNLQESQWTLLLLLRPPATSIAAAAAAAAVAVAAVGASAASASAASAH